MNKGGTLNQNQLNYLVNNSHDFDYILALDFECTCEENEQLNPQEIIEFPIVVLDLRNNEILPLKFHSYVKPTCYPQLSQFCKQLTNISQDQVDQGISIEEALNELHDWLKETRILESRFCFATVGVCDLQTFLKMECHVKGLKVHSYLKKFINVIHKFKTFLQQPYNRGLKKMMDTLKLDFIGRQHSGIDDAFNTARVLQELVSRGALIKQSDVWSTEGKAKNQETQKSYSSNSLFPTIQHFQNQFQTLSFTNNTNYSINSTNYQNFYQDEYYEQITKQNTVKKYNYNDKFNQNYQTQQTNQLTSTNSSSYSSPNSQNSNNSICLGQNQTIFDFSFEENGPKLQKRKRPPSIIDNKNLLNDKCSTATAQK